MTPDPGALVTALRETATGRTVPELLIEVGEYLYRLGDGPMAEDCRSAGHRLAALLASEATTREGAEPDALAAVEAEWREKAEARIKGRDALPMHIHVRARLEATAFAYRQCADDLAAYRRATRAKETRA